MNTIRISVPLTMDEAQKLIALAKRERRHPREQAAYFIAEKLRECGELLKPDPKPQPAGGTIQ